ncbi:MAG: hypothetical protein ISEC1_P0345 [Thiomicrorhabdus sp.]|nr:MAG: hypothetical protein ISEC1_P0345 [Thiomicrorhabdus sp.]
MFGAEWCDYCQLLKEEVIVPMAASGLYDGKVVLMRHVGVDEPDPILHWNDQKLKKSKWAYQINADITPTIIFLMVQVRRSLQELSAFRR